MTNTTYQIKTDEIGWDETLVLTINRDPASLTNTQWDELALWVKETFPLSDEISHGFSPTRGTYYFEEDDDDDDDEDTDDDGDDDPTQRLNDLLFRFANKTIEEMPVEDINDETLPAMWRAFLSKTAPDLVTKETLWSEVRGMTGAYPLRQCIAVNAVMTAAEAEHKLDWAQGTMAKACRRGQYPTARQSGGVWLIPRSAVMARLADTHTRYPDTDNADELLDDGKSVLSKIRNQKLPDEDTD